MTQKNTGRDDIFFLLSPSLEMPMRQFLPESWNKVTVQTLGSLFGGSAAARERLSRNIAWGSFVAVWQ